MDKPSSLALSAEPEPTTNMDDIYNWAIQSPYSPLNLQHLNQPRLQGAPREWTGQFTFRDAFEDLLITTSGRSQPSVWELLQRKAYEFSAPLNVLHWVSGLGLQGLWGSYFVLAPPLQNRIDWAPSRNVDISYRQLYFWQRSASFLSIYDHPDDTLLNSTGVLTGLLLQAFRDQPEMRAAMEDHPHRSTLLTGLLPWLRRAFREPFEEHPATEEDLYNSMPTHRFWDWKDPRAEERIREVVDKAMKEFEARQMKNGNLPAPAPILTTPKSLPSADPVPTPKDAPADQASDWVAGQTRTPDIKTTVYADGSRSVQVTERYSSNGRTETTVTSKHFDASGNLLAERRESSSTRSWSGRIPGGEASFAWTWDKDVKTEGEKDEGVGEKAEKDEKDEKGGKGGWFWK
ncbi:hypothetical protein F4861DRAFT_386964 [Xylaria intraflava]|nr:hypothetical protein F4861DRAFT_386964 [Xylaria intraflava]